MMRKEVPVLPVCEGETMRKEVPVLPVCERETVRKEVPVLPASLGEWWEERCPSCCPFSSFWC